MQAENPDIRSSAWKICIGISAAICIVWSLLGPLESKSITRVALFSLSGFSMLGLVFFFPKITDRGARNLIIISAIVLRLLLWMAPVSDDVNRYLWEGELVLAGENPYAAPADDARWESRRDEIWEGMNHRDRPTAYPPGVQWIMAATAALGHELQTFKLLSLIGDLVTLHLIIGYLRKRALPLRWAGFYAFNPIILIAFAAEAHFDSLMIAAMLAAVISASRGKSSAWLWLGIAIQIKLICIILIPLFLTHKLLRSSYILPLLLILPSLPFISALPEWLAGVREFAGSGAFNAPFHTFLAAAGIPHTTVRLILTPAFCLTAAAICILHWRGKSDIIESSIWMLSALLFFSPIVHFWYLAWVLPLVALRPSFAWIILSITMSGYFLAWWTAENMGWWGFGHGIAACIWLPGIVAAIAQNRFLFSRLAKPQLTLAVSNEIAIVLPILNPGNKLPEFLRSIRENENTPLEIVIVDGGSDNPEAIAGTKVITSEKGRGNQIAKGISATSSPWILIAHVDTIPTPNFIERIRKGIAENPDASLLVLGQRFDRQTIGTLFIETLNEIRVVFGGVAFGDQTMILRREALERENGFPAQPLMEDVEASMRMASAGRVVYLGSEWTVSAGKWKTGFLQRVSLVVKLVAHYQISRLSGREQAARVSERMYSEYYK